ncbi:hypothetical protein [Nesterenkonia sp. HG001]|uniref:hypothetical protein n=1 Tax=Nesterenkonia sp. HG001 TaxID=2983207 RepID=UPI002AC6DD80|nr:hypothetical protein [Nesterenkonia sp. HG001]MDZ5077643.1 hypothetical protein [Nesterenkonia sp. HG001]
MNPADGSHFRPSSDEAPRGRLPWRLILLLGAVALLRPLMHITGVSGGGDVLPKGLFAVGATVVISAVWIGVVLLARVSRPFLTLVLAGLVYAVLSMVLSAVLSPVLGGELQGPFAQPIAIPMVLIVNAIWGAVVGGIAAGLRAALVSRHR